MKWFLVILVLFVAGCSDSLSPRREGQVPFFHEAGFDFIEPVVKYWRDPRTELCFAYGWAGSMHGGPVFASVPCEPAVLTQIDVQRLNAERSR